MCAGRHCLRCLRCACARGRKDQAPFLPGQKAQPGRREHQVCPARQALIDMRMLQALKVVPRFREPLAPLQLRENWEGLAAQLCRQFPDRLQSYLRMAEPGQRWPSLRLGWAYPAMSL